MNQWPTIQWFGAKNTLGGAVLQQLHTRSKKNKTQKKRRGWKWPLNDK